MKKRGLSICLVIIVALSTCVGFFGAFLKPQKTTFADNAEPISIVGNAYSGEGQSSFTPFDFTAGARRAGYSVCPEIDSDTSFEMSFNFSAMVDDINEYELGLWVYFSTSNSYDLKFTLVGTASSQPITIIRKFDAEVVNDLMQKPENAEIIDLEEDGFGWNYLQVPLREFVPQGDTSITFESLTVKYGSDEVVENAAKLYLYDIKLAATTFSTAEVLDENKQPFRFCKFEFYTPEQLSEVYLGDSLTIGSSSSVLKYAWVGELNIKELIDFGIERYSVSAFVGEEPWVFDFGFQFNQLGVQIVKFQITDNENPTEDFLWQAYVLTINNFVGLTFRQNIARYEVGKTVRFFVTSNSHLTNLTNLKFSIVGDCATIIEQNTDLKYVDVLIKKTGDFDLIATAKGTRLNDGDIDMEAKKTFSAFKTDTTKKTTTKVLLYVSLGAILLAGVVSGIKAIVNANKYKVR